MRNMRFFGEISQHQRIPFIPCRKDLLKKKGRDLFTVFRLRQEIQMIRTNRRSPVSQEFDGPGRYQGKGLADHYAQGGDTHDLSISIARYEYEQSRLLSEVLPPG